MSNKHVRIWNRLNIPNEIQTIALEILNEYDDNDKLVSEPYNYEEDEDPYIIIRDNTCGLSIFIFMTHTSIITKTN